jgi:hypothetical protein
MLTPAVDALEAAQNAHAAIGQPPFGGHIEVIRERLKRREP